MPAAPRPDPRDHFADRGLRVDFKGPFTRESPGLLAKTLGRFLAR